MAKIPDIGALGNAPSPRPSGAIVSYEGGAGRGIAAASQGLTQASRDLEAVSSMVSQANAQQDEIVATSAANELARRLMLAEFDPEQGFRSVKEGGAVGPDFVKKYGSVYNDAVTGLRASLHNDYQRRVFDKHAEVRGLQFNASLLKHQAEQTELFNSAVDNATIDTHLREIGTDPTNTARFETGLIQINDTIEKMGRRKGLPQNVVDGIKAKFRDSAQSVRIMSLLEGIPGVAPGSPDAAWKVFDQVRDSLGPEAIARLSPAINRGIKQMRARGNAEAIIFGAAPMSPKILQQAVDGTPFDALRSVVREMESGGDPNAYNPKSGASGPMQVIKATWTDPGFGVRPAQIGQDGKPAPGELERVGVDYLGAMSARYGNPALTMAAYNAGPHLLDDWINGTNLTKKNPQKIRLGDPRVGEVGLADWVKSIPYKETREYVMKGLMKLSSMPEGPKTPTPAPSARQLKVDLMDRVAYAREIAKAQFPGDTEYEDALAARVENLGRQVIEKAAAVESAAHETLVRGAIGSKPDGSDAPKNIDELLARPEMRRAWEVATPEVKEAIQHRFARGSKWDQSSMDRYYQLLGMATRDPETFADDSKTNLAREFGVIPDAQLVQLMGLQRSINQKDAKEQAKQANYMHAYSLVDSMLKPLKLGKSARPKTTQSEETEMFYGRLRADMDAFVDANGKRPSDKDILNMATALLVEGKVRREMIWDKSTRAFQMTPEDEGKFYVPLPAESSVEYKALVAQYEAAMGRKPTKPQLEAAYTAWKLSTSKQPRGTRSSGVGGQW